jgi:hypothetical protein
MVSRTGKVRIVFTDSYRDTFASVGVQLRSQDGCASGDIEDAERRFGIKIPVSLNEYYLLSGREKRINQFHNRLLPPEKWFVDSSHLVFMEENQWVVYWGISAAQEPKTDAGVFQGVNLRDKGIEWHAEHDSCFTFLNVMAIWHASLGGAVANTAVGYVQEGLARKTLDEGWQFVGEVNAMRAYKQVGRAVCFLKWEDFMQKRRNLPAWRVFAAAASEGDLERIKASLQAQWEEWGG